jgi:hypothetical protein
MGYDQFLKGGMIPERLAKILANPAGKKNQKAKRRLAIRIIF